MVKQDGQRPANRPHGPAPPPSWKQEEQAGEGAIVGNLDMRDPRDRRMLLLAVRRWRAIDDEMRVRHVRALDVALGMAVKAEDHRSIAGIVRTLMGLEGQNQQDEHLAIKLRLGIDLEDGLRKIEWTEPAGLLSEADEADGG